MAKKKDSKHIHLVFTRQPNGGNQLIAWNIGEAMQRNDNAAIMKTRLDSVLRIAYPGPNWSAVTSELHQEGYALRV